MESAAINLANEQQLQLTNDFSNLLGGPVVEEAMRFWRPNFGNRILQQSATLKATPQNRGFRISSLSQAQVGSNPGPLPGVWRSCATPIPVVDGTIRAGNNLGRPTSVATSIETVGNDARTDIATNFDPDFSALQEWANTLNRPQPQDIEALPRSCNPVDLLSTRLDDSRRRIFRNRSIYGRTPWMVPGNSFNETGNCSFTSFNGLPISQREEIPLSPNVSDLESQTNRRHVVTNPFELTPVVWGLQSDSLHENSEPNPYCDFGATPPDGMENTPGVNFNHSSNLTPSAFRFGSMSPERNLTFFALP
jgi:hypothetical protein